MKFQQRTLVLALTLLNFGSMNSYAAPTLQIHGDYSYDNHKKANAWLEINIRAFENNINRLQNTLQHNTKICAVMKADAYGNGINLLMPSVIKLGVGCIGIVSNEEAKVARIHGYTGRIIRLRTADIEEVKAGLPFEIEELTGSRTHAYALNQLAKNSQQIIHIHLAINSGGMNHDSLDLSLDLDKQDAIAITKLPHLHTAAIMTHYAFEDESFIRERLALFKEQSDWLIKTASLNRQQIILHTANSFAAISVPETHLDMVRVGSAIYGNTTDIHPAYQPIMSFKSKITSIQFYPIGTQIGSDVTYTLARDSYLANLPFGYSSGYRRAFTKQGAVIISNTGVVLVGGQRVNVIGKTSANSTMIDITDIINKQAVNIGDEVVIYGRQNDEQITQAEIESMNNASLADLYTIWSDSNPRIINPY